MRQTKATRLKSNCNCQRISIHIHPNTHSLQHTHTYSHIHPFTHTHALDSQQLSACFVSGLHNYHNLISAHFARLLVLCFAVCIYYSSSLYFCFCFFYFFFSLFLISLSFFFLLLFFIFLIFFCCLFPSVLFFYFKFILIDIC